MGTVLGWTLILASSVLIEKDLLPEITAEKFQNYCSLFGMGAIIGSLPAGKVTSMIGNRYGMILFEVFVISGWLLLIMLNAVWMLILGTILKGIGIGALCTIIPVYIGEISQKHIRGKYQSNEFTV